MRLVSSIDFSEFISGDASSESSGGSVALAVGMNAGDCKESFLGLSWKNKFFLGLPRPAALPQHLEPWLENRVPVAAIVWTDPKGPGLASLSGPHLASFYAHGY